MTIEAGQCVGMFYNTLVFVEHNKTTGAHHRAGSKTAVAQAFVVHHALFAFGGFQQQVGRQNGYRRTTGNAGFQALTIGNTAAVFIAENEFFHADVHINFVHTRLVDIAAGTHEFGTRRTTYTNFCIVISTIINDGHNCCNGFYVVYHRWAIPQTFYRRKWRLNARVAPLAFQAFDEGCFFTTDISTTTTLYIYFEVVTGAQNVFTQPAIVLGFGNGLLQNIRNPGVLTTDVDVCTIGTQCIR